MWGASSRQYRTIPQIFPLRGVAALLAISQKSLATPLTSHVKTHIFSFRPKMGREFWRHFWNCFGNFKLWWDCRFHFFFFFFKIFDIIAITTRCFSRINGEIRSRKVYFRKVSCLICFHKCNSRSNTSEHDIVVLTWVSNLNPTKFPGLIPLIKFFYSQGYTFQYWW